jgi:hypothetical protein
VTACGAGIKGRGMKMRTGVLDMDFAIPEIVKKLTVCFLALFNRQCISKAFVYLYHNGPEEDEEETGNQVAETSQDDGKIGSEENAFNQALIRSLKYGTLSPHGIGAELKPYLQLAHSKGYLEPEDYEDNQYATRVVQEIFPQVDAEWKKNGELGAKEWVMQYCLKLFLDAELIASEAAWAGDISENDDMLGNVSEDQDDSSIIEEMEESDNNDDADTCMCDFCEEMRLYDNVDLANIKTNDPLDNLMINSLKNALLKN